MRVHCATFWQRTSTTAPRMDDPTVSTTAPTAPSLAALPDRFMADAMPLARK
jgi:hypothetical protein